MVAKLAMSHLLENALAAGLINKVQLVRQDDEGLHFVAQGSAPGQKRITYEAPGSPGDAVAKVLDRLVTLSPKNSPQGDVAAEVLAKDGRKPPVRGEDPPEPVPVIDRPKRG